MTKHGGSDFLRGSTDLMILSTLVDGEQYGYSIQQRLAAASGGRVRLKAGTLYPLLHRLEDQRFIKSRIDASTGRQRKWYQLTAAGRRRLQAQAIEWNACAECLRNLLAPVLEAAKVAEAS